MIATVVPNAYRVRLNFAKGGIGYKLTLTLFGLAGPIKEG